MPSNHRSTSAKTGTSTKHSIGANTGFRAGARVLARRVPTLVAAAAALGLLLTGCGSGPSSPSSSATGEPPASSAPTQGSTPSPSATTTAGCKSTPGGMPSDATAKSTIDVDGDGKPDTEWISSSPDLRFGVTTASGATASFALNSASPNRREGFIARLNDHRILSLVDDGRGAYLHFFVNCAWVQPKNAQGADYTFDMADLRGNGTGVGCSLGYVYGYNAVAASGSSSYTVTATKILLNTDGSRATNGPTTTLVTKAPASDPKVKLAQTITCGTATVANAGVTLDG